MLSITGQLLTSPPNPKVRGEEVGSERRASLLRVTQLMNTKLGTKPGLPHPSSIHPIWKGLWKHLKTVSAADITCSLCPSLYAIWYTYIPKEDQ